MSDEHNYSSSVEVVNTPSDNSSTLTTLDPESFKQSIVSDVLIALKQHLPLMLQRTIRQLDLEEDGTKRSDDLLSVAASNNYNLDEDKSPDDSGQNIPEDISSENNVPEDFSSEKHNNNKSSHAGSGCHDSMTDLFPNRIRHHNHVSQFDVTEDILLQVDSEMPQSIDLGEKLKENLATRVATHFNIKSKESNVRKEILNRHKLPSNCVKLSVPKLNKSIMTMKSFSEFQKRNEKSFYEIQSVLLKATTAITRTMDDALKADEESKVINTKNVVKNCLDAVTLLGYATSELSNKRKQNVRTSLNPQFRDLCNPNREVTEFLLGDDLQKGMKEAQETAKLQHQPMSGYGYKKSYGKQGYKSNYHQSKPYSASTSRKPSQHFLETGKKPQQGQWRFRK